MRGGRTNEQAYLQTYIERDVSSLKSIGNLDLFRRFLQLCAGRTGQLLNLSAIGAEAGIDHKTVRLWLSILEAGFVIFLLPPYFRNFNKRIVKSSKLYFYDTGIVCSLLGLNSAQYIRSFYMRGSLFENYVIAEYLKMGRHQGKIPKIYFWRDNTGNEIDMLIDQGDALHAVEIKSGTTIQQRFFTACGNLKNIPASAQKTVTWYMAEIKPSSAKTGRYLTGAAFICCRDYEPVALFESVRAKKIMMSSSPFT